MTSDEEYREFTRHHYMESEVADRYAVGQKSAVRAPAEWAVARLEIATVTAAVRTLDVTSDMTVLDVPAGTGKLHPMLTATFGRYVAADVSQAMLRHVPAGAPRAQADATQLPFGDDSVDVVVVLRLLHRIPRQLVEDVLREAARVARVGVVASYAAPAKYKALHRAVRAVGGRAINTTTVLEPRQMSEVVASLGGRVTLDRSISFGVTSERVVAATLSGSG